MTLHCGAMDQSQVMLAARVVDLQIGQSDVPDSAPEKGIEQLRTDVKGNASRLRHSLTKLIKKAIEQADDPTSYKSIFEAMCSLAKSHTGQFPFLLSYSPEDKAVKWLCGITDEVRFFEAENMRGLMRTLLPKSPKR